MVRGSAGTKLLSAAWGDFMRGWRILAGGLALSIILGGCSGAKGEKKTGQASVQKDTDAALTPFAPYDGNIYAWENDWVK